MDEAVESSDYFGFHQLELNAIERLTTKQNESSKISCLENQFIVECKQKGLCKLKDI